MAKGTIGGKIVLEGESQYREALKKIKTEQTELRSEMRLCQSTFKDNQNSLDALKKKHEILTKQIDSQTKKVEVYQKALLQSTQKEQTAAEKVTTLKEALEKAEKEMKDMKGSSDSTSDALEDQAKVIEDLKNKLTLAQQDYDKAAQKTTTYKTSVNNAQAELQGMQGELKKTEKYIEEAASSTDKCATSIDKYGKETQDAKEKTSVFGDVLKANLASEVIISGVKKLAQGIKEVAEASVEVGTEFEASMLQVAATMGMTAEEINAGSEEYEKLSNAAKDCGKTTKFSASEAGEALNYLALAGYDVEKSVNTLPKVLDLAAAGNLDLAYASDLVTDSMAALGMETKDLDKYIDEMAKTSQKSNTSVSQLGEATLICAGTVTMTKQKLETMNAELGVLANNGIKGAEGGTHLRNILLSLAAPTDSAESALEKLNIRVSDSSGNMRDLNDIMIDLNAAMEGMSSTEKTQIINKIFNKTDIASVNALMKGTGEEFKNLKKELENCSGAASNMAETMNNNLKGKVTILKSSLEGLGISAYEIFDDDMKTAVDGATDAVGRLQKSIDSGNLGVSLNKMSKALGDLCENAIDVGEDALPDVIDGFTWILENGDIVVSCLAAITAGQIEMAVAPKIINACNAAWEAYQLVTQGAATWQEVLNVSMAANPAGLLLTAVTALTAGVAAYVLINKDNLFATDEVTKSTREQVNAAKELNEQYASASSERADARQNLEAEAISCKNLVTELQNLSSKQNLSNTEQTRMKMIVEQLNQKMPELNLQIDKQTGKLNMSTDALKDNVDAMMAMARAEAAREDLTRIAEDQYEAEKQLAKLEKQLEEQKLAVADAQNRANESMREAQELYGDNTELMGTMGAAEANALIQAQDAQKSLEEQIESTKQTINGFTDEYSETMQYISDTEGLATATEATAELGATAENTSGQIVTMSEEAQEAYQNMFEKVSDAVTSQMDLFSEFNSSSQLTTEQLLSNMQSQVDGISQWSANIAELADRGISQGLLQTLSEMGPEGAGYVSAFVSMTDEELQKASGLFEESLKVKDEAINEVMQSYQDAGSNMVKSLSDGIEENKDLPKEASATVMKETIDAANEEAEINSPSGKTEESGLNLDKGLEKGINGGKEGVIKCMQSMISDMIVTAQEGLKESTFEEIGKKVASGLQSGIESGKSGVLASVDKMKSEVKSSMDDINSVIKESMPNPSSGATKSVSENSQASMYTKSAAIESIRDSMSDINAVIRESLPDTSMMEYSGSSSKAISEQASAMDVEKYTDAIVNAINKKMTQLKIVAQSDTANLFRFMVKENNKNIMSTGINKMNR